jgi:hypothetical protein
VRGIVQEPLFIAPSPKPPAHQCFKLEHADWQRLCTYVNGDRGLHCLDAASRCEPRAVSTEEFTAQATFTEAARCWRELARCWDDLTRR